MPDYASMTVEELTDARLQLQDERAAAETEIEGKQLEIQAVLDVKVAEESAAARVQDMSEAERAALLEALQNPVVVAEEPAEEEGDG